MGKTTKNKVVQTTKTASLTKVDKNTKVLRPIVTKKKIKCQLGQCPVCFDELGTDGSNMIAYTRCGHLFCLRCLLQVLKRQKKCPTCRGSLAGHAAFQALYVSSHPYCFGDGENGEGSNVDEASLSSSQSKIVTIK